MFKVRFIRDSVNFVSGASNSKEIVFNNDKADLRVIIPALEANSFLPHVPDDNVRWEIFNARQEKLVVYVPKFRMTVYMGKDNGKSQQPKNRLLKDACTLNMTLFVRHHPLNIDMDELRDRLMEILADEDMSDLFDE